jgi:polyhydroxybutyrate depolymerase
MWTVAGRGNAMTSSVATWPLLGAAIALAWTASAAQADSVRQVFEKYDLLGTFAVDCGKPPSEENWYFVHEAISEDRIQRNMLTGPATRKFQFVYDQASELRQNEIAVHGARDGAPLDAIWHLERGRQIETETTLRGVKVIAAGKFLSNGREVPWTTKCAAPGERTATSSQDPASGAMQLTVNGKPRTFLLRQPTAQGRHPTIIMLHGYTKDAADISEATGLGRLAPLQGFVAAFPNGLGHQWNHYLPGKELPFFVQELQKSGGIPDDVAFLKALVADLVGRGISDPKRVYLAGESNGGFMTMRMICAFPEMFAAAGVVIGGMPEALGAGCQPPKPIPLVMVHGTSDRIVPYNGGVVPVGAPIPVWPTDRTLTFFRKLDGCVEPPERALVPGQLAHKVEIERSTPCVGGAVLFYRIVGGGHERWPDLKVGQLFLDFFRDKTR